MLAYTELLRAEPADAERHTAEALASGPAVSSPLLQFGLQAVQGAAVFDLGDRVDGLAELRRSRSDLGDHETGPEQAATPLRTLFRSDSTPRSGRVRSASSTPPPARSPRPTGQRYRGDYLVLAAGARANFFRTPGPPSTLAPQRGRSSHLTPRHHPSHPTGWVSLARAGSGRRAANRPSMAITANTASAARRPSTRASLLMFNAAVVTSGGTPASVSAVWSWASDRNGTPEASGCSPAFAAAPGSPGSPARPAARRR